MKKTLILFLLAPICCLSCAHKYNVEVINEDSKIGDVTSGGSFTSGSYVVLEAKVNTEYIGKNLFTGWYKVENEFETALSFENPYLYKVTDSDIKIKAKWEEYSTKTFTFDYKEDSNTYALSLYRNSGEKNIIVPKTHYGLEVDEIQPYTFAGLKGVDSVQIRDNIITIGEYAFMNSNLSTITLPSELDSSVGDNIFYGWTSSQIINIPASCFNEGTNRTKWGWTLTSVPSSDYFINEDGKCGSSTVLFNKID